MPDISSNPLSHNHSLIVRVVIMLFMAWAPHASAQQHVFENSKQYLGYYRPQLGEYGDEITLGGTARLITDFSFPYTTKFTSQGDERARIRFYANDGNILSPYYTAPGTLLYESGFFPLNPGAGRRDFKNLNIVVPDKFTWTIEFRGLSMALNDQAGLLYFNPVTVGQSYGDYWVKNEQGVWLPLQTRGLDDNFGASFFATYAPDSTPRITSFRPNGSSSFDLIVNVIQGRNYALEYADPAESMQWHRLETILKAPSSELRLTANAAKPARLFRVKEMARSVSMLGGQPLVTAKAIKGTTYVLEYINSLSQTNWIRLPEFMTATSDIVSILDLSKPVPPTRFYRINEANDR